MSKMRLVLVVGVIIGAAVLTGAGPAAAARDQPLEVTSTGLSEGQAVGPRLWIHPTWTAGAEVVKVEVAANDVTRTYTEWSRGLQVPMGSGWDDIDVRVTVRIFTAEATTAEAATTVRADTSYPMATFTPRSTPIVHGVVAVTADTYSDDVASMALHGDFTGPPVETITAAPWTFQWDTVHGPQRVGVAVTDRAGNVAKYSLDLTVDNIPPRISEVEYYYGGVPGRVHGKAEMHVTFSDTSGVNRTQWVVDGVAVGGYTGGPTTRISGDLRDYDFGVSSRTVPVEIHAWDRGGNETVKSFTVTVDSEAPRITAIGPARNALVRGSLITSTVQATDPAGIGYGVLNGQRYVFTDGANVLKDTATGGPDGQKKLVWQVVDKLGNSTTATQLVILDNTRPTLSMNAPKNGAKVSGTVKITGTAADRNGINRIELLVNGKVVIKTGAATYRFTLNPKTYGKTFKITARTYDRAGNATSLATRTWHQ
jgi:hypothetical protein